jgi:phospholipid/cholesterol/gamma-HCH transport system substrate-binding protein
MVGAASIVAVLGISGLLFFFGELDPILHPRYAIDVELNDAGGVRPGSVVELSGVPVGLVTAIDIHAGHEYPVVCHAMIEHGRRIPAAAVPEVIKPLIGGASVLHLSMAAPPADDSSPPPAAGDLPTDGSGRLRGTYRSMAEQIAAGLDARMGPIMKSLDRFTELSDTYATLGRNLNEMVAPQDPGAIEQGGAPNLRTAVTKLNAALDEIREALAMARSWLGDEQMQGDARSAITKANELIDKATATFDRYSDLAGGFQADADELTRRVLPVADELAATLEEVRRVTRQASAGDGTIAQLLNNPDLYNALTDASIRLEKALADAQLLMQKIRAEGLPIDY